MNELIKIKQLPVIEEHLKKMSEDIDKKIENATSLICTQENVKEIKKVKAELNNDFKELETLRKEVKEKVLKPYNEFEDIYKKYVTEKFKNAESILKEKIETVENELRKSIEEKLRKYFSELTIREKISFVKFEQAGISINLDLITEKGELSKKAKDKINEFILKVVDDIKLINSQEYSDEILIEYQKDLNVSKAICDVKDRHFILEQNRLAKEKAEQDFQELTDKAMLEKVEVLSAPVEVVEEEILELTFKVRSTRTKLKELKNFLNDGGYDYE